MDDAAVEQAATPTLGAQAVVLIAGLLLSSHAAWALVGVTILPRMTGENTSADLALGFVVGGIVLTALQAGLLGLALVLRGVAKARTGRVWTVWSAYWPSAALGVAVAAVVAAGGSDAAVLWALPPPLAALLFAGVVWLAARVRLPRPAVSVLAVVLGAFGLWVALPLLGLGL